MLKPVLIAIHVSSIVLWIGGVAFVTIVIFPMLVKMEDSFQKAMFFQRVESVFARLARIYVIVAGISGIILLYLTGEYHELFTLKGLDVTLMLIVWTVFFLILLLEKNIFKFLFSDESAKDRDKVFLRMSVFHWLVLSFSLLTIFIGVISGHGGSLF